MKLRFTIRDLILVTIIAALAVGWWVDRQSLLNTYRKYTLQKTGFQESGATTQVDYLIETSTGGSWLRLGDNWSTTTDFVPLKLPAGGQGWRPQPRDWGVRAAATGQSPPTTPPTHYQDTTTACMMAGIADHIQSFDELFETVLKSAPHC